MPREGAHLALRGTARGEEQGRAKPTTGPRVKAPLFPGEPRKEKTLAGRWRYGSQSSQPRGTNEAQSLTSGGYRMEDAIPPSPSETVVAWW